MKNLILIALVTFASFAKAQNSGVYLTASDFESGKLTYGIDCAKEKHKIKLHEFLGKDYITVVHNQQSNNLKKNEIFGYKDCSGVVSRLGLDKHYEIVNPTEKILIYKIETPASKSQSKKTSYYFSATPGSDIQYLTLMNLKKAFPENHRFHDALDTEFKSDNDLTQYDSFHKVFKINRIFSNAIN